MWLDPPDLLNGETGLGTPSAEVRGYDIWTGLDQLGIYLANGNALDAIRISYSADGDPARLSQVLLPACGNGVVDDGEVCDDGNSASGDCCSDACQPEPAGTVCRAATDPCDVAERCNGTAATCPSDIVLPDVNGDGVCECAADLAAAASALEDGDADDATDAKDDCPDTPAGVEVDASGCSQSQFCAAISLATPAGRATCRKADWGNDEAARAARDCAIDRRQSGPDDDLCVMREPD
jgi:cysteine-rich repeat protein